jgi:methyl-accepting chemotaxis protein
MASNNKTYWTEPYVDSVSGNAMITSAYPIIKDSKRLGCTTVDISIKDLEDYVRNIKVGNSGYAFILTRDGYYLADKQANKNLKVKMTEEKDKNLSALGKVIYNAKEAGLTNAVINNIKNHVMYVPIGQTGMKLVLVMPETETSSGTNLTAYFWQVTGIFVIAIIILGIALSYLVTFLITRPLAEVAEVTEKVANGDMTVKEIDTTRQDEIGNFICSFNKMTKHLKKLIEQITVAVQSVAENAEQMSETTEQTTSAVTQITQSAQDLAAGAEQQSQKVQYTMASIEKSSLTLEHMASTAQQVSAASSETSQRAKDGNEAMNKAMKEIEKINISAKEVSGIINQLGERSQTIGQIVELISSIAGQTNLLALNAAIEAARAGEQGKGFAVVAEEVRKLAEQSSNAVKEIAPLIKMIQDDTTKAVQAMENNSQLVVGGSKVIGEGAEDFNHIEKAIDSVSVEIQKVSKSTMDMAKDTEELVRAIKVIDEVTQQVSTSAEVMASNTEEQAASIEELSATADSLSDMACELKKAISQFRI